jgi:hypothetical protein
MTLAGIGMIDRSTRRRWRWQCGIQDASLSAGDRAIEGGFQWLLSQSGTPNLNNTNLAMGYYASLAQRASRTDQIRDLGERP